MKNKKIRENFKNEIRRIKSDDFSFKKNDNNPKMLVQEKKYNSYLEIKTVKQNFQAQLLSSSSYLKLIFRVLFMFSNLIFEIEFNLVNYSFLRHIRKENSRTIQFAGSESKTFLINKILQLLFLIIMALIILFPFYWMLNISLTPDEYLMQGSVPPFFPTHWSFKPYEDLINYINNNNVYAVSFWRIIGNTVFVTVVSVVVQIIVSIVAGFAIANFKNVFTKLTTIIFMGTLAIPGESLILGQLIFMKQIGLGNSFIALVVPFAANVMGIYLIAKAFESVPSQLKKAARVDGLSDIKFFFKVAIPQIKYTIMIVVLFSIISSWNSLLWPTTVLNSDSKWVTLPMMLWGLIDPENLPSSSLENPVNLKMAGTIISTIPMLLLCVIFNKLFIRGNQNINA
ncbi:multiple sugar transport system permease protein [Spiroplasma sp. TIUS-1]|uniref:carbohydrate ABC transporter permease n=1 Tax=Spiroplasma sp. TIUS-1 TaxID=216963 RepID=UPI001398E2DE|nr:carbohydrate ABC transporter permease [Spiroplasma sp. TIUS-1]QHX35669.1 multiple sugar transport system permease protein [Spiroplasma sp. TIUS-1]